MPITSWTVRPNRSAMPWFAKVITPWSDTRTIPASEAEKMTRSCSSFSRSNVSACLRSVMSSPELMIPVIRPASSLTTALCQATMRRSPSFRRMGFSLYSRDAISPASMRL